MKRQQIIKESTYGRFDWPIYTLNKKGQLVDEDEIIGNKKWPTFKNADAAEKWLQKNNERGNVKESIKKTPNIKESFFGGYVDLKPFSPTTDRTNIFRLTKDFLINGLRDKDLKNKNEIKSALKKLGKSTDPLTVNQVIRKIQIELLENKMITEAKHKKGTNIKESFFGGYVDLKPFSMGTFIINEKINSEKSFRDYAYTVLKNAHKDKYDQSIADKMLDDIIKQYNSDWPTLIGILQSSLSESSLIPEASVSPAEAFFNQNYKDIIKVFNKYNKDSWFKKPTYDKINKIVKLFTKAIMLELGDEYPSTLIYNTSWEYFANEILTNEQKPTYKGYINYMFR